MERSSERRQQMVDFCDGFDISLPGLLWKRAVKRFCSVCFCLHTKSAFSALTLLVGCQEGHLAGKKWGDGGGGPRNPSWMVGVSASVNLPLHHKVQKFLFWHRLTRVVPEKGP